MADRYDVAILGGGLAGLCLGIQLKRARPETSVLTTVGRKGPAPEAAFKVGESTVEISAYYFGEVVGLKDHMEEQHLPKFSLRYFFPAGDNRDITKRFEFGTSRHPEVAAYQLDRGRFENELWKRNVDMGVELLDDCKVTDVELGEEVHDIAFTRGGEEMSAQARWVVDTTGRGGLLRNKLGLNQEMDHNINAAWFRLAGGLKLDEFSEDPDWHGRIAAEKERWLSTNHLLGEGYWVWLIPLASGPISIGIVADPRHHPYEEINTLDGALSWLERHEPQLHAAVTQRRDEVQDFLTLENFSYGCERVLSPQRWALSGEASLFLDPFYSPGSDFIARANTFATDLIRRDLEGEPIEEALEFFNTHIKILAEGVFLKLYQNQYPGFGNPNVAPAKLLWDHSVYWWISCLGVLHGRFPDLEFDQKMLPIIAPTVLLNQRMQEIFQAWRELKPPTPRAGFFDLSQNPVIWEDWCALAHPIQDDDELLAAFAQNVKKTEALCVQMFCEAARSLPGDPLPADAKVNPYGVSLDPDRWEEDGLLNGEGMTLAEARELVPDVDAVFSREAVSA